MTLDPAHLDKTFEPPIDGDPNAHIFRVDRLFPDPIVAIFRQIGNRLEQVVGLTTVPCKLEEATADHSDEILRPHRAAGLPALEFRWFLEALHNAGHSNSLESMRKLDILDLGCGSEIPEANSWTRYPPELCRALHRAGVRVVGVDVMPQDIKDKNQGWEFHRLDLTEKNALSVFSSNSFDVVSMDLFLGHVNPDATSPRLGGFTFQLDSPEYIKIEMEVFTQALRILRTGGLLKVNNNIVYRKVVDKTNFCFKFELVTGSGKEELPYTYFDCSALQFQECSPQAISLT